MDLWNKKNELRDKRDSELRLARDEGYKVFALRNGDSIRKRVMDSLDKSLETIPALSFWNYFTGKADRVFCDKIRSCVGLSIENAFSIYI